MSWVPPSCALSRILYSRCNYFMYFALVEFCTCNWSMGLLLIALRVRISIYLLNVHCSHSLMTNPIWSRYAYMFYCVYTLDRILLAYIRTMYSTCHKLNESFVCVRVMRTSIDTLWDPTKILEYLPKKAKIQILIENPYQRL